MSTLKDIRIEMLNASIRTYRRLVKITEDQIVEFNARIDRVEKEIHEDNRRIDVQIEHAYGEFANEDSIKLLECYKKNKQINLDRYNDLNKILLNYETELADYAREIDLLEEELSYLQGENVPIVKGETN